MAMISRGLMKLSSGEFETEVDGGFVISITREGDISDDGGYSFPMVTNSFEIDTANAKHLIDELQHFVDYGK